MTPSGSVKPPIPQVRRLQAEDWALYRDIRLRALDESPGAFGSTAADARRLSAADWRGRLAGRTSFVATAGSAVVGLVSGISGEAAGEAELISMWVDPGWRRQGVGRQLVEAVLSWAIKEGFGRVRLWVAEGNAGAERFYSRLGFRATGERQPMGGRNAAMEFAMVRLLG